jgi:hypothetical protein
MLQYSPQITGSLIISGTINGVDLLQLSQSLDGTLSAVQIATGSSIARLTELENKSASVDTSISNINEFTASNNIGLLNSYTQSNDTTNQNQNNRLDIIENTTGSYETKGRGLVSGSSQVIEIISTLNSYTSSLNNAIQLTGSTVSFLGDIIVYGTQSIINSTNVEISDNILYLSPTASIDNDLGVVGHYNDGTYRHAGIFMDASDGHSWKVFNGLQDETSAQIDTSGTGFTLADFKAGAFTGTSFNGQILSNNGVVSGSSQITYANISSIPVGIVSGSSQVIGILSSLNSKTGSYATTGSNTFIGTEIISGNLLITGSVGIGTTNPVRTLHVMGGVAFDMTSVGLIIQEQDGVSQIVSYKQTGATYSDLHLRGANLGIVINGSTGNVGIGTTSTSYKLNVNGSIRAGSGNSTALLVAAAGTASTQAAIAIQQLTTEGDTIIFADFEPYATYGIVAKNDVDSIDFNAGNSGAGLTSYNIVNRTGTTVPAYVKTRIDLTNGYLSVGARVGIGTISPVVSLDMGYKTDAIALPKGTTGQRPSAASGMIRYNTSLNYVEYYDSSNWIPLLPKVTLGASAANPAESAYEIKTYNAFATNGFYWIKQTGATPIYAYCVFTENGGGAIAGGPWTVPFISGDANSNFSTNGTTAAATFLSKCQAIGINTPGRGMESSRTTSEVYGAWLAVKRALWEGYGSFITNGNASAGAVLRMPMININGEGGASAHRLIYNTSLSTHIPPNIDGDACNAGQLFCGWWGANDVSGWRTNNNDLPGPEDWGPSDNVNAAYNGSGIQSVLTMCVYR